MKRLLRTLALLIAAVSTLHAQQPLFPTGCEFDQVKHDEVEKAAPQLSRNYKNLPKKVSMRQFCPQPRNQSPYNTCVGWSTAYSARSIINNIETGSTDMVANTEQAFSPSYIYNQIRTDEDCNSPAYIHEGIDLMIDQGCAKLEDFPFDCESTIRESDKQMASAFKIEDYKSLTPYRDIQITEIHAIKKAVSEKKPVVVAMKCFDSFMKVGEDGIWDGEADRYYGHHAIVIIGYDDQINGGSFEIMNSWGTGWANNGFAWVRYEDMQQYCAGAYEMIFNYQNAGNIGSPDQAYNLASTMRFVKDSGEKMEATYNRKTGVYEMWRAYRSGTKFRIYVKTTAAGYVYIIGTDATDRVGQLFPYKEGMSASLSYAENEIALPAENAFVKMDNTVGTDYLAVFYTKTPLDIEDVKTKVELADGSFPQRVREALGSRFVDGQDVIYDKGGDIGFKADVGKHSVVTLIVEMDHVE